jgi:hypothetical protein
MLSEFARSPRNVTRIPIYDLRWIYDKSAAASTLLCLYCEYCFRCVTGLRKSYPQAHMGITPV